MSDLIPETHMVPYSSLGEINDVSILLFLWLCIEIANVFNVTDVFNLLIIVGNMWQ